MKKLAWLLCIAILLTGCSASPSPEDTEPLEATLPEEVVASQESAPKETVPQETVPTMDRRVLDMLTTEEKVGQLFLARCRESSALSHLQKYHLGGYLLFGVDIEGETPSSLRNKLAEYQTTGKLPILIAVDEEGGTVCRVSSREAFRAERFPSPRNAFKEGGMEGALQNERDICELLSSVGINVNLGPVCDITTSSGSFMYKRSLGQDPETTGNFIAGTVEIMQEYGVGSCLKHFPGYGNNVDTHVGSATDKRSLEELESVDLVPFQHGIEAGCGAIMVTHTVVAALDDETPASLSPAVHQYLREKMGFDGVIITDDLKMQAISGVYGTGEAAVLAILAGNDMLCSSSYETQYQAVLKAVEEGRISMEMLDAAVLRVLRWKISLGLI